jgi:hypothetical protein
MKDWLESTYSWENKQHSYNKLRRMVKEAWEAVPKWELVELLKTMPQRCQDVIDAKGGYTKW